MFCTRTFYYEILFTNISVSATNARQVSSDFPHFFPPLQTRERIFQLRTIAAVKILLRPLTTQHFACNKNDLARLIAQSVYSRAHMRNEEFLRARI